MPRPRKWYEIKALADGNAEVYIYDEIVEPFIAEWWGIGVSAKSFKDELDQMKGKVNQLDVRINSPGGSVFEGSTIANMLRDFPANITVYVDGLAASIASVIAMAGNEIVMGENAFMMIHDPWMISAGTSGDLRHAADLLDKIKDSVVSSYVKKSGQEPATIAEMMAKETWFTAQEAVDAGLADKIQEPIQAAASMNRFELVVRYKNTPKTLIPQEKTDDPETAKNSDPEPELKDSLKAPEETLSTVWKLSLARKRLELEE